MKPQNTVVQLMLVVMLGLLFADSAYSATAAEPPVGAATALAAIKTVITSMEDMLKGMVANNGGVRQLGIQLLGFFVLVNVSWALVKGMATGRMLDYMIGELLPIGLAGVIAWMFLGQVANVSDLGTAVQAFMNEFGSIVAPNTYSKTGDVYDIVANSITHSFKVLVDVMFMKFASATTGFWNFNAAGVVLVLISAVFRIITVVIVFLIVVCAVAAFIGTLIFTQIAMYIALIVMPLFIPFMVFKPLESYFDRWLSFFVSAIMAKIIGSLIVQITDNVMENMATLSGKLPPAENSIEGLVVDIAIYVTLILMAAICYMLVSKIDGIAKGLTGSLSLGFNGFGRELSGGMGGIGKGSGIGGGGSAGGAGGGGSTKLNAASTLTSMVPNIAKPLTYVAGKMISNAQGKKAHAQDLREQIKRNDFEGPHRAGQEQVTRDLSKMPKQTADAYRAAASKANAKNVNTPNGTPEQRMPTVEKKTT